MNILFIHQNFPGQFKHLAPALANLGHHVSTLTMRDINESEWQKVKIFKYRPNRSSTPNIHPWLIDFETKIIRGEEVFKQAMSLKNRGYMPDLIIAHPSWGESLFLKEVWPSVKMALYCEFYYLEKGADLGFDPEFYEPDEAECCRLQVKNLSNLMQFEIFDAGISPTYWQASTYPEHIRKLISVIHDGIDTNIVAPNINASISFEHGLTLTKNDEIITFIARNLEPYRGFHVFMRALPDILKRRPNARVLIIGNNEVSYGQPPKNGGNWKDVIVAEVAPRLSEEDWQRIHFLGSIPYHQFLKVLQISTVHVYLTYPFVLSWSLLEAMSAGCSIIASDTTPLQEVITHNQTGILVNFFDGQKLVQEINDLLDNVELRQYLGRNAREFARAKYDLHNVCLPLQLKWVDGLLR